MGCSITRGQCPTTKGELWRAAGIDDAILMRQERDRDVVPDDGLPRFWCGIDVAACACGHAADFLCDWPIGDGKTCDLAVCKCCRREIGPNKDVCEIHWHVWKQETGGMPIVPRKPSIVR